MIQQEERAEGLQRALNACNDSRDRLAVLAIAETESVDEAALVLYNDVDTRIALRLSSEDAAIKFVAKHVVRVAERITPG